MTDLHVVYRVAPDDEGRERWETYSFPHGVFVVASTLAQARDEFRSAARYAMDDFDKVRLFEHIERPLIDDSFIRTAIDRRSLDRDETASTMRSSLTVSGQLRDFRTRAVLSAAGDAVVVACVAGDTLEWVLDQMGEDDALIVCVRVSEMGVWWSFLAGDRAVVDGRERLETLDSAGLSTGSMISDLMLSDRESSGRLVVAGL